VVQHHLDLSQARPMLQEVRGKGVAEHVGRHHLPDPRPRRGAEEARLWLNYIHDVIQGDWYSRRVIAVLNHLCH